MLVLSSLILIPNFGIIGAAYAVVLAFFSMSLAIYIKSQYIYPIAYDWKTVLIPIIFLFITYLEVINFSSKLFLSIIFPIIWYLLALNTKRKEGNQRSN